VVGLAVGLAIGTQAALTVQAIVKYFINPLVGYIVGSTNGLESAKWSVGDVHHRHMTIGYGQILSSLIMLLAVALVVYVIVHGFRLDRLDVKKDDDQK